MSMQGGLLALGAALIITGFILYSVWFRGRKFQEIAIKDSVEILPDWWPFAKFNRIGLTQHGNSEMHRIN
jgi:hypothetical protein